jgi:hypothetical protein
MGLPISIWLKNDPILASLLNDMIFSGKPRIHQFVLPEFLEKLRASFHSDKTSFYGDSLWLYLVLENWLQKNNI